MKIEDDYNEELIMKLQNNLLQRDKEERLAAATLTTEILTRLNISIDALPQRCQNLLYQCTSLSKNMAHLDPVAISVRQSKEISQRMTEEYNLLELRQRNAKLRMQIDRNKKFIEGLKAELQSSRESLAGRNPNPENIQDHVREMRQKLATYELVCEKTKTKFAKLQVPETVLPKSLEDLASRLASLKVEEENLRQRADDITLARQARKTLYELKKMSQNK